MNTQHPPAIFRRKRLAGQIMHVTTCGALALLLTAGPGLYDTQNGFLSYPSAHASSCFTAQTKVLMADGREVPIDQVRVGERVVGRDGHINRVKDIERVPLAGRRLYAFNGGDAFVTAEHPFMTAQGWRSIDPHRTTAENPALVLERLVEGDHLVRFAGFAMQPAEQGSAALAAAPLAQFETEVLAEIRAQEAPAELIVFNLLLDGNHSYIADGYLVHNKGGDSDSSGSGSSGSSGGSDSDSSGSGSSGSSDSDSSGSGSSGSSDSDDSDDSDSSGSGSSGSSDDDSDDSDSSGSGSGSSGSSDSDDNDDNDDSDSGRNDSWDDDDDRNDDQNDDSRNGHRSGDDVDRHQGRGRGRGEHGFPDDMGDMDDEDELFRRGRGADDVIEGHRSAGPHPDRSPDRNRSGIEDNQARIGQDDSPGRSDRNRRAGPDISGRELSPAEEAAAIENGWQ